MRLHRHFEWDPKQAAANREKHRVTFEEARAVLGDEEGDRYHVEDRDDKHSMGEDRYVTFGSHPDNRRLVLRISWTERSAGRRLVTRIIIARLATRHERKRYAEEITRE